MRSVGSFYTAIRNEKLVVYKWPRRWKKTDRCSDFYRDQMRAAAAMLKYAIPQELESALNFSKGSNDTYKDILFRAQFGTLFQVVLPDGTICGIADHTCPPLEQQDTSDMPWSIITRWEHAVDGDTAEVNALLPDSTQQVAVVAHAITVNTTRNLRAYISTDDGATYWTTNGNYIGVINGGGSSNAPGMIITPTTVAGSRSGFLNIQPTSIGLKTCMGVSPMWNTPMYLFVADDNPVTNIKISNELTGLITGGAITILGR